MQAHEGESILSYLLSVPVLEKTKPPFEEVVKLYSAL